MPGTFVQARVGPGIGAVGSWLARIGVVVDVGTRSMIEPHRTKHAAGPTPAAGSGSPNYPIAIRSESAPCSSHRGRASTNCSVLGPAAEVFGSGAGFAPGAAEAAGGRAAAGEAGGAGVAGLGA